MFRLPETFALSPPSLRDLRPLPPASSYAYPSICALGHALARRACDAGARKAAKRVSNTSPARFARLELIPHSLVSRETREGHPRRPKRERERGFDTRPGCPLLRRGLRPRCARPAPPALRREERRLCRAPPADGVQYSYVSRETCEHQPTFLTRARPMSVSGPRSESRLYQYDLTSRMRRRTHPRPSPSP